MDENYRVRGEGTIRLFENDFLEALTKVPPILPPLVFLPPVGYWFYQTFHTYHLKVGTAAALFLFGLLVWTVFEYALHRFVFHFPIRGKLLKRIHFLFHGIHHAYPSDSMRVVMPPVVSIPLASGLYWLAAKALPAQFVPIFFAGFILGYLFYDLSHFAVHRLAVRNPILVAIRKHHFKHHYLDPNRSFGVSSSLWDHLLGTLPEPRSKTEPASSGQL